MAVRIIGYLKNKKIYFLDINSELINTHNVVKNNSIDLISNLKKYRKKYSKDFYYVARVLDLKNPNIVDITIILSAIKTLKVA